MSIDLADAGRYVFYVNMETRGITGDTFMTSEQNFKFNELLDQSDKYICSIERFSVPLMSIPMRNAITSAFTFNPKAALPPQFINTNNSFSLLDWLEQVNNKVNGFTVSLTSDGRIAILYTNFDDYSITLNNEVSDMFDMDPVIGLNLLGSNEILGASVFFDKFDQVQLVRIEATAGLQNVQQEIQTGNKYIATLTDFFASGSFSMNYQASRGTVPNGDFNITFPVRQNLEFSNSSDRRYIMLRGNSPIQNIAVEVTWISRIDQSRNRIIMPKGSVFSMKLAFWKK